MGLCEETGGSTAGVTTLEDPEDTARAGERQPQCFWREPCLTHSPQLQFGEVLTQHGLFPCWVAVM